MTHEEALRQIKDLAVQLSKLRAETASDKSNLGLLLGVLYALARAMVLRFEDRTGAALPHDYPNELSDISMSIGRGALPQDGQWLAGFYFNSALQRLSAIYHRTLRVLNNAEGSRRSAPQLARDAIAKKLLPQDKLVAFLVVQDEINRLKHVSDSVLVNRPVDIALAVMAAKEAVFLLNLTRNRGDA